MFDLFLECESRFVLHVAVKDVDGHSSWDLLCVQKSLSIADTHVTNLFSRLLAVTLFVLFDSVGHLGKLRYHISSVTSRPHAPNTLPSQIYHALLTYASRE